MTPSAIPHVSSEFYVEEFNGDQPAPKDEVVKSIEEDPDVHELFSLQKGAVIGEF